MAESASNVPRPRCNLAVIASTPWSVIDPPIEHPVGVRCMLRSAPMRSTEKNYRRGLISFDSHRFPPPATWMPQ